MACYHCLFVVFSEHDSTSYIECRSVVLRVVWERGPGGYLWPLVAFPMPPVHFSVSRQAYPWDLRARLCHPRAFSRFSYHRGPAVARLISGRLLLGCLMFTLLLVGPLLVAWLIEILFY